MSSSSKSGFGTSLYTPEFFKAMAVLFLLFITWSMFFTLPILIDRLGGDPVQIGIIMGATPVAAVAIRLVLGPWMDRAGRKKVLISSGALNAAVMILFLTVRNAGPWPVFLRALQGVAYGGYFSVLFTIISDLAPPARLTEGLGNFGIAGMAALAFGPWLGEALVRRFDFPGLFIAAGAFSLAALPLSLVLRESRPPPFCEMALPSLRGVLNRSVGGILLVTLAFASSRAAAVSFLAEFCRVRGVGSIGLYSLVYALTTIAFRFFAGPVADRRGPARLLVPFLIVFGAGTCLLSIFRSIGVLLAAAFLGGLGHCFLYPALNSLAIRKAGVCNRGTATGLFTAAFDLGLGAAWIWGPVAQAGGYPIMFLIAGFAAWLGIPAALRMGTRETRETRETQ